jgi:hypothetical protein
MLAMKVHFSEGLRQRDFELRRKHLTQEEKPPLLPPWILGCERQEGKPVFLPALGPPGSF